MKQIVANLHHDNYEKDKQIETGNGKIYELKNELANYERKNNDLKAEIRGLRNRDEEPTVDMIRGELPRLVYIQYRYRYI